MLKLLKKFYLYVLSLFLVIIVISFIFLSKSYEKTISYQHHGIQNFNFRFLPEIEMVISNNLFDITNFTFSIQPRSDICVTNIVNFTIIKAIFIVTSHINNVETRSAMRRAFSEKDLKKLGVRRVFLLGLFDPNC